MKGEDQVLKMERLAQLLVLNKCLLWSIKNPNTEERKKKKKSCKDDKGLERLTISCSKQCLRV